ncbi:MAG: penicillin-binding protein activator LpoB [Planctomycetes bacterium]|nr:penicillin-binding protein activator LpoB [Planctomycetota bacterium]HRV83025.1 penicillin-binding protein activator LpoB [Planctomycetota bacterium]
MKLYSLLSATFLFLPLTACSSQSHYVDADKSEGVTIDYGRGDLNRFAESMVTSLLEFPGLSHLDHAGKGDDKRIVLYFNNIVNETREHISMGGIRDQILDGLVKDGRFRIVAGEQGQSEIGDQVRFQQDSGRVNPELAKAFGKQLGADVVVYGALRDIVKTDNRDLENLGTKTRDVFYQFFLRMDNIETGETIWTNTKQLAKREVLGLFAR